MYRVTVRCCWRMYTHIVAMTIAGPCGYIATQVIDVYLGVKGSDASGAYVFKTVL